MAGPWEKYQAAPSAQPPAGPWAQYSPAPAIPSPPTVSTAEDIGRGGIAGLGQAGEMTAGMFGDVAQAGNNLGDFLLNVTRKFQGKPALTEQQKAMLDTKVPFQPPTTASVQQFVNRVVPGVGAAIDYQPQSTPGQYAKTLGTFMGASAVGGPRAVAAAIPSALASEAAGQMTKGTAAEPYARIAGSFAGPMGVSMARRTITPFPVSNERAAAVGTLRKEGVRDLTAGQMTGNDKLRYIESELGGSKMSRMQNRQGEQYTAAVLKRAGINANRATPEVIDNAFTRIGSVFDNMAVNNTAKIDPQFATDLTDALKWYGGRVGPPNRAPLIGDYANEISNSIKNGQIDGATYQSLRSRIRADARGAGDQYLQSTLNDMANALDGAMERSLTNPADVTAWRNARREYRNMLVIEKAASGAGENTALGIISPPQLRTATKAVMGTRSYARGKDEFSGLAHAGESVMRPMPQSGTAPRTAVRNVINVVPALLGGSAGAGLAGIPGSIAGMIGGASVPFALGRALLSSPVRRYMANGLLGIPSPRTTGELAAAFNAATTPLRLPAPQAAR